MVFYVGQKVVCVDASNRHYGTWRLVKGANMNGLTEGVVYTIREIKTVWGHTAISLVEIVRPVRGEIGRKFGEVGYHSARFRPAVEPDIQQFRDLVAPIFNGQRTKELAS